MTSLAKIKTMFANMATDTNWKIDGDLLWGYFFIDPSPAKLESLAHDLANKGYLVVGIHCGDGTTKHVLHVEMIETHTPATLHQRELALAALAIEFGIESYDGMDVGPLVASSTGTNKPLIKHLNWVYVAEYDDGPGTILLDLGLHAHSPFNGYAGLVKASIKFQTDRPDGLPDEATLDSLYELEDQVDTCIETLGPAIWAGSFTCARERHIYTYVQDVGGVEQALNALYESMNLPARPTTKIMQDPNWECYNNFLYPNQPTIEYHRRELQEIGFFD